MQLILDLISNNDGRQLSEQMIYIFAYSEIIINKNTS